jgi:tetratricopeptide (TPR) repeat protein
MFLTLIKPKNRTYLYVIMGVLLVCLLAGSLLFTESSQTPQMTSDELFEKGQYYFNHGDAADGSYDLAQAASYYRQALELAPHPLAWYQLGRIDFLEGRNDEAIDKFNTQLELYGDLVPKAFYMLGLTHAFKAMRQDDADSWQEAEANFIHYMRFVNHAPWPAVDLAWVYFMQGKYTDMKPLLEETLNQHPENPWVLNMYGLALLNSERNKPDASAYFLKAKIAAAKLTPNDWGDVYPGNNPQYWKQGRDEFVATIDKNLVIANSSQ